MDGGSTLALVGRLLVSLAVVLGLMVAAAAVLRRRAMPGGGTRRKALPIEVLARQGLSKGASVAVVRAGGRDLVLGVTEQSVRLLAEADLEPVEPAAPIVALSSPIDLTPRPLAALAAAPTAAPAPPGPTPTGSGLVDRLRDMTVRRV